MELSTLAPYLAGPGSAVLVCILIGWGGYKLMSDKILPLLETAVSRHLDQIDRMMETHSTEHRAILTACETITDELRRDRAPAPRVANG
jgi:hypothetical protein